MTNPTELIELLRKRVVVWCKNYTEMDCNRVRDAKPIMDDLLQALKALQARLDSESASVNRLDDALEALQDEAIDRELYVIAIEANAEALQAENERLRGELAETLQYKDTVLNQCEALQAENERLKSGLLGRRDNEDD